MVNNKPIRFVAWTWSLLACASFVWAYFHLTSFTKTMIELYPGLDVALPLSARLVVAAHTFIYPLFFGIAAIMVVVKEIIMRNKVVSLATTVTAIIGVFAMLGWIEMILYSPLIDLAQKLSK